MAVNVFIKDLPIKTTPLVEGDKFIVQRDNTEIVNLSSIRNFLSLNTLTTTVTALSSVTPFNRFTVMTFENGLLTNLRYV